MAPETPARSPHRGRAVLPRRAALLLAGLALATLLTATLPARAIDIHQPEVKAFIDHMAQQYPFSKHQLRKLLKAARSQPAILEAMQRPAEKAKSWYEYRTLFITERRIREGTSFWLTHREALDRAAVRSGVAPEYLAAILGVETYYGRLTGSYRVIDALATLAFDYPPRAPFFRDELEQYLLLTREMRLDPLALKGSYAGAMGAPQFMPSNYRRYGVDANADGRIDLWGNWSDVCASVGNYLKEHGWNAGEPVLVEAEVPPQQGVPGATAANNALAAPAATAAPGATASPSPGASAAPGATATAAPAAALDGHTLDLSETVGSLKAKGVRFDSPLPDDAPALLIEADEADGAHWRVGFNNFYAITRYNHSALYAMAVYELAQVLKERILVHDAPRPGDPPPESAANTPTPP